MRKNLPDRKLTLKEKMELLKHHYEKPDHICDCGCGYPKATCMKEYQEAWAEKQEKKKKEDKKEEVKKP
jgi:hypothetical protein